MIFEKNIKNPILR